MHLHHRRRTLALLASTAIGAAGLVGLAGQAPASAATTFVVGNPATCANTDFRTIQDAVDAAAPGDTIQVCAGNFGGTVTVDKPDLTFLGAAAGMDARGKRSKKISTIVSNRAGDFILGGSADNTTIDGFVLSGASDVGADAVQSFQGSSGLTLVNNVIQNNGNGINLQNPDASMPALISRNNFANNSANYDRSGQNGTGIFVSNGPADSTTISDNSFKQHEETAINFAGDGSRPSTDLVVRDNKSTDDSTFVVAVNSDGAVIDHNIVSTNSANTVGGPHGTGILDFGSNTGLQITSNVMKDVDTPGTSTAINLNNFTGVASSGTTVTGNTVTGWYNDLKVIGGQISVYAADNKLLKAANDGIFVDNSIAGATFNHNTVAAAGNLSCEDQSGGDGTAGTANMWISNKAKGAPSSPAAICPSR